MSWQRWLISHHNIHLFLTCLSWRHVIYDMIEIHSHIVQSKSTGTPMNFTIAIKRIGFMVSIMSTQCVRIPPTASDQFFSSENSSCGARYRPPKNRLLESGPNSQHSRCVSCIFHIAVQICYFIAMSKYKFNLFKNLFKLF